MNRNDPSGERVALVADDDEFFRMALKDILLSRLGLTKVIAVGSFDEAVDRLGDEDLAQSLSLGLFDLSMPGITNPLNLRAIREAVPELVVVVVSGSEQRSDVLKSLEAGVHGYVPKGLGIEGLERALGAIMSGDIYVPQFLTDLSRAPHQVLMPSPELSPGAHRLPNLTPRQHHVLDLVVKGRSNKEIARELGLGEGTVRVHLTTLFRNLGVTNRTSAAALAAPLLSNR